MFEEAPVIGTGPGTWVIQRPHYTLPPETDYFIPHAHNLEAQTLAELGLLGAAAGVVLVAGILRLIRNAVRGDDLVRRRWGWVGGVGLLYFVLHQVLDFYVNMPAFLFAAAIPVAYLDATAPPSARSPSTLQWLSVARGRPATLLGGAIVVLAIAGLLLQEVPALRQAQAVDAAGAHDWAAADDPARAAAAMDQDIGSYQLTAGLTASRSGDHVAAAAYFERVAERDDLPEAWLNLAAEQASLGQSDAALASLRSALRLGYQRPAVAMPAGDLALRLGEVDLAAAAFGEAIVRTPSLAGDPWWQSDASRAALFPTLIERALAIAPSARWEIALETGDIASARELAAGDERLRLLTAAWFGDTDVGEAFVAGCRANLLDTFMIAWCSRIEARAGRPAVAHAYRQLTSLVNLATGFQTAELRVSNSGLVGEQLPGEPADLWATYTYRRPGPWDLLVPSLVHLTLE
jgi:tetratricopeptide (TPR) repeat protein